MNVIRGLPVVAAFAAVAVGAAAPASAAAEMSGHYIETETSPDSQPNTNDWYVTPCGDGCASVVSNGAFLGQALLTNGQWTMDGAVNIICGDGTDVPNAASSHFTWDPYTLAGTVQITQNQAVCGHAPDPPYTDNIQLTQAP